MAYLTFIARKLPVATYELTKSVVLGRSYDCGIFIPDIFASRKHCRFEPTMDGWLITDLGSRNGIHFMGQTVPRRLLKDGDLIELGTIAIQFHAGSLLDDNENAESNPAPFGNGASVIELVDTLFAGGARPSEYIKSRRRRPPKRKRVGSPAGLVQSPGSEWTELDLEIQIETNSLCTRNVLAQPHGERDGDWAELDVEWQVMEAAVDAAASPALAARAAALAAVAADDEEDTADEYAPAGASAVGASSSLSTRKRPTRTPPPGQRQQSSSDRPDEIDLHPIKPNPTGAATMRPQRGPSQPDLWQSASIDQSAEEARLPSKGPRRQVIDGVVVEREGMMAGLRNSMGEYMGNAIRFAKLNPLIAALLLLVLGMGIAFGIKYAPIDSGPHIYTGDPGYSPSLAKTSKK